VGREINEVEGDLKEITAAAKAQAIKDRKREQGRSQTLDELVKIGRARGMRRPELWAKFVLRARAQKLAQGLK
jgi:hypothetical protein